MNGAEWPAGHEPPGYHRHPDLCGPGGGNSKMNGDGDDCVFVCVCDGKRAINRLSIKADVQPAPPLPPVELVWVRMGVYGTLRGEREGCEEVNVCPSQ